MGTPSPLPPLVFPFTWLSGALRHDKIVKSHRASIKNARELADIEDHIEDRIYALLTEILKCVSTFIQPVDEHKGWITHPQPLLVPENHIASSTKEYLNIRPDLIFFLSFLIQSGITVVRTLAALFEAKRLPDEDTSSTSSDSGQSSQLSTSTEGELVHGTVFSQNIGQLLLQAFLAMHAFPSEKAIHIVFVVGNWFSVLRFETPKSGLAEVPMSLLDATEPNPDDTEEIARQRAVAALMPVDEMLPEILFFGEPLFDCVVRQEALEFTDPLALSAPFCDTLSVMLPQLEDMDIIPCTIFAKTLQPGLEPEDIKVDYPELQVKVKEVFVISSQLL